MTFNIVLVEPEIPQNTGNIVRTCAATGSMLHLVGPLGFSIEDRYLKRAGLDYWKEAKVKYYDNFEELKNKYNNGRFLYATTKSPKSYSEVEYGDGDFIVFGKETKGLPEDLLEANMSSLLRIPMREQIRSLNLSNSVAVVLYEALRQNEFRGLETESKRFECETIV